MEGKNHHYERIIGGTQEEKDEVSVKLQTAFETPDKGFAEYEIKKLPEDIEFIQKIESAIDEIILRYEGKPKPLPLDNICILQPGGVLKITDGELSGGIHQPIPQKIGVEKGKSKLLFASTLAHELFHLKSYKSARVGNFGKEIHLYRSGLSMIDRKKPNERAGEEKEFFSILEEAIVAECTRQFIQKIGNEPSFSNEVEAVKKFRDWVTLSYRSHGIPEEKIKEIEDELKYINDPQNRVKEVLAYSDIETKRQIFAAGMFQSLCEKGDIETFERHSERKKLYDLLDKLVISSKGKFNNREEIFNEFAKANFSGNYLPLARIIEDILGKGSFRKLAEEFSEEPRKRTREATESKLTELREDLEISEPTKTETIENREGILEEKLFSLQIRYCEKLWKKEIPFPDGNIEQMTFEEIMNRYSDISGEIHSAYIKRTGKVPGFEEREEIEKISNRILLEIHRAHDSHPTTWESNILSIIENVMKTLPENHTNQEFKEKREVSRVGLLRYEVRSGLRGLEGLAKNVMNEEDECIMIHLDPLYKQQALGVTESLSESFQKLAEKITTEYPHIKAVIAESWIVDSSIGKRIGFHEFPSQFEDFYHGESFWGQFYDQNGEINQKRIDQFLNTGKAPFVVKGGYFTTNEFLGKYLKN